MKATVTSIRGFDDLFVSMYLSKRTWTPDLDADIRDTCDRVVDSRGRLRERANACDVTKFGDWMQKALRMGVHHITILRFLDISIMTEGLHRAGQDDIDAHAARFNNRIIRNSTRLATFDDGEFSDFYKDKVLTCQQAMAILGIEVPDRLEFDGHMYVKSPNGYVLEEYADDKDVKRGLYMLGIPSNFISKINLCEWGHVFKQRNNAGHANPEVKLWAESVTEQAHQFHEQFTRDFILSIEN